MSDITLAASANAFEQLFNVLRNNFTFAKSDSGSFGPFSASYAVALHLDGGTLQLNDDGTIQIQDLDIVFDTLKVQVCFDLPASVSEAGASSPTHGTAAWCQFRDFASAAQSVRRWT